MNVIEEYMREAAEAVEEPDYPLRVAMYVRCEGILLRGQLRQDADDFNQVTVRRIVPWLDLTECMVNPLMHALDLMTKACRQPGKDTFHAN